MGDVEEQRVLWGQLTNGAIRDAVKRRDLPDLLKVITTAEEHFADHGVLEEAKKLSQEMTRRLLDTAQCDATSKSLGKLRPVMDKLKKWDGVDNEMTAQFQGL